MVSEEPLESGTSLHSRILCFGGSRSNSSSGKLIACNIEVIYY